MIMKALKLFLLSSVIVMKADCSSAQVPSKVTQVVNHSIAEEFEIVPLLGGNSLSKNYLITTSSQKYVLRSMEHKSEQRSNAEIYAMLAADALAIGPKIYNAYPADRMLLMDYVESKPWNMSEAQKPENCLKIADVLRKAHTIPRSPYQDTTRFEVMEKFYNELRVIAPIRIYVDAAIMGVRTGYNALKNVPGSHPTTIHNDLNPGNILVTQDDKILLIDWEGTNWEDPFYDLSYFAIMHGYNGEHEHLLLSGYLGKEPSQDELLRYSLTKKGNLARLAMSCFYIAFVQCKGAVDLNSPLKNLNSYIAAFSEKSYDGLSKEQFFFNFGRAFLNQQ